MHQSSYNNEVTLYTTREALKVLQPREVVHLLTAAALPATLI
jgi:hypothetical protein